MDKRTIARNMAMPIFAALAGNAVAKELPRPPMPPEPAIVVQDMRRGEKPVAVECKDEIVAENGLVRMVRASFVFTNPNTRAMRGDFEFPVPAGATVCGYALEIDGVMVPGVVCAKEKARVAFENEVRKGVDPGIVEHVKGDIWKTSIFPLNCNVPRRAYVEYVQPVADGVAATVFEKDGDDIFIGERGLAAEAAKDPVASFAEGVILWDASGSAERHAAQWRAKLSALPEGGKWRLVAFRNTPEDLGVFDKAGLLAKIDAMVYDGGTDIAKAIAFAGRARALMFSDEADTLSLAVPRYDDMPNIVVASREQAPARPVRIRRLAAGEKLPDGAEVKAGKLLATQWAAERVKDLSAQADARKDEFLALGRRYGVASAVTSLIVLERLEQYLEHGIEPPATLGFHDEWVRRNAAKDKEIEAREGDAEHERDLLKLWKERVEWWNSPIPKRNTPKSGLFDSVAGAVRAAAAPDDGIEANAAAMEEGSTFSAMAAGGGRRGLARAAASMAMREAPDAEAAAPVEPPASQAGGGGATIRLAAWTPDAPYLKAIEGAADKYATYLEEKKKNSSSPAFFIDAAGVFFRAGDNALGARILSNMAEFKLEDAAIWRSMGWRLREAGCIEDAILCFRHALRLRTEEGQSRRDLALVLSEYGKDARDAAALSEALALLKETAFKNWERRSGRRSNDRQVSIVALEELNALLAWCAACDIKVDAPQLDSAYRRDLPVKIRIVLSWDADETDIDIHVLEPDGEEAYYQNRRTVSGGFVGEDVTTGYGPEEYLRKEASGVFKILAHYYSSHQTALTGAVTATATVYTDWATAAEKRQIITLRLDKPKTKVLIGEVEVE